MIAFHLIVARKNKFEIPDRLPKRLLISGTFLKMDQFDLTVEILL